MLEVIEKFNDVDIKYMFKPGNRDVEHLIIIFSGYGGSSLFTYDFAGKSLEDIPCSILWIKDDFEGVPCFYLCKERKFFIEETVYKFIEHKMNLLSLNKDKVTLLGASKGGFASLYFGIKYKFKNIIASAPIIDLGTFLNIDSHVVSRNGMYSKETDDNTIFFNELLYSLISTNDIFNLHINIVFSNCDEHQSFDKVNPLLDSKCKNFSSICVNSNLVTKHNEITRYSVPIIKMLLLHSIYEFHTKKSSVVGKISSHFNFEKNKEIIDGFQNRSDYFEAYFEKFLYSKNNLQMQFVFVNRILGSFKDIHLLLTSPKAKYTFKLRKIGSLNVNMKYYKYFYTDLDNCCYELDKPININTLTPSLYKMHIVVSDGQTERNVPIVSSNPINTILNKEVSVIGKLISERETFRTMLLVSPVLSCFEPDFFELSKTKVTNDSIYFLGNFVRYGLICDLWQDLDFYMVFENSSKEIVETIRIGKGNNPSLLSLFNGNNLNSKCSFLPIANKNLKLGTDFKLKDGLYTVYISMINETSLFSHKIFSLTIKDGIIIKESEYCGKRNPDIKPDLDKNSIDELLRINQDSVATEIIKYINNLESTLPINFYKYTKIRDFLYKTNQLSLLDYLNFNLRKILNNDILEELK